MSNWDELDENTQFLLNHYNIKPEIVENTELNPKIIAAAAYSIHEQDSIKAAGLFGSRTDPRRNVHEESDIDLAIRFSTQDEESWETTCFDIERTIGTKFSPQVENRLDLTILNEKGHENSFLETLERQVIMIKGSKNELIQSL